MPRRTSVRSATRDLTELGGDAAIADLRPETRQALDEAGVDLPAIAGADARLKGKAELGALARALAHGGEHITLRAKDSSGAWAPTASGLALRLIRGELAHRGAESVIDAARPGAGPSREAAADFVERAARVDPAEAARSRAAIEAKTGLRVRDWSSRLDEPRDARLVEVAHRVARPDLGVDASTLLVVSMGEGLVLFGVGRQPIDTGAPVDGYQYLGTDVIGSAAPQLIAKGYLRPTFRDGVDYETYRTTNDGQHAAQVVTARFADVERGLEAMVALLADARAAFVADWDAVHGPDARARLSDRALFFFTALYYNTGAPTGRKILEKRGLRAMDQKHTIDDPVSSRDAPLNAQQKLNVYDHWVAIGLVSRGA